MFIEYEKSNGIKGTVPFAVLPSQVESEPPQHDCPAAPRPGGSVAWLFGGSWNLI